MPDGKFPVEVIQGVPVVATPAEIDITNTEALRSALLKAATNRHGTLVVDMTQTRFCDSSGLHTLIAAHNRAQAEGREMLLIIPGTPVLRVFALTGIDRVIPNFTTLAEALAPPAATANGRSRQRTGEMPVPNTSRHSQPPPGDLPGTLKRSPEEAQEIGHQGACQCRAEIRRRRPGVPRRVRRVQPNVRETRRPLDPEQGEPC